MNLYLLSQTENISFGTFNSCVVCAENEKDAKSIMPDLFLNKGKPFEVPDMQCVWAYSIERIQCVEIGTANKSQQRGVIIASYNDGAY